MWRPSYRGDSIGRWDGDTLVVDTTNFTDANWMHAEGLVSFHSDALHIVERYRRADANTIEVEATIEDPKVLTGPWVVPEQTAAARAVRSDHGSRLLGYRDGGADGRRLETELRQEIAGAAHRKSNVPLLFQACRRPPSWRDDVAARAGRS